MVGGIASWRRSPGADHRRRRHEEAVVDQLAEQLLDEERVALRRLADLDLHLGSAARPAQQAGDQFLALDLGQRLERHGGRPSACRRPRLVASRAARRGPWTISRIGASRVHSAMCSTRSRKVGSPSARRRARGPAVACGPWPRTSCGWPRRSRRAPGLSSMPEQAAHDGGDPLASGSAPSTSRRRAVAPPASHPPRSSSVTDRLGHRPVGDPLAVREAPPDGDPRAWSPDEPMNSSTRRDFPTPAAPRMVNSWQIRSSTASLGTPRPTGAAVAAPDQRRAPAARVSCGCGVDTSISRHAGTGSALPFSVSGSTASAVTAARTRATSRAQQDLARRSGRLRRSGHVDGVAGHDPLPGAGVAGDHLAGVDAHPPLDRDARSAGSRRPARQPLPISMAARQARARRPRGASARRRPPPPRRR